MWLLIYNFHVLSLRFHPVFFKLEGGSNHQ
ncbi:hypothetical protein DM49_2269 [Burkholderia mallei]|nr:hypothetical protein DP44_5591 [Burkholderia pseudomallei]KOS75908.1 hypothetical protein DM46_1618 [Burkholderia mallei]KOS95795.1 hypothetical protein DM49_2269 [Burkholderia mallei]